MYLLIWEWRKKLSNYNVAVIHSEGKVQGAAGAPTYPSTSVREGHGEWRRMWEGAGESLLLRCHFRGTPVQRPEGKEFKIHLETQVQLDCSMKQVW